MNTNSDIIEKIVMQAYMAILKTCTPTVSAVHGLIDDVVDRNAYNVIYNDVNFKKISEQDIQAILCKYKCLHSYFAVTYYNSQNMIFQEWKPQMKMLEGDICDNKI